MTATLDYGIPGKKMNPGATFKGGGVSLLIPLLTDVGIMSFYLLVRANVHVYIIVSILSSWIIKLLRYYDYLLVEANVHEYICDCYCK